MKRAFVAMLALLLCVSCTTLAGVPEPIPFKNLLMSVNLGKPHGDTKFAIECSETRSSFDRVMKSIMFLTQSGNVFEAPHSMLAEFRNPVALVLTSYPENGGLAVYVNFDYSPRPNVVRPATLKFKDGKFVVIRR